MARIYGTSGRRKYLYRPVPEISFTRLGCMIVVESLSTHHSFRTHTQTTCMPGWNVLVPFAFHWREMLWSMLTQYDKCLHIEICQMEQRKSCETWQLSSTRPSKQDKGSFTWSPTIIWVIRPVGDSAGIHIRLFSNTPTNRFSEPKEAHVSGLTRQFLKIPRGWGASC